MAFTFTTIPGSLSDLVLDRDAAAGIAYASDILPISSLAPTGYRIEEPRSVLMELLGGDEVLVSIDGGVTYPFSLSAEAETLYAALTTEAPPEMLFTSAGESLIQLMISEMPILKVQPT